MIALARDLSCLGFALLCFALVYSVLLCFAALCLVCLFFNIFCCSAFAHCSGVHAGRDDVDESVVRPCRFFRVEEHAYCLLAMLVDRLMLIDRSICPFTLLWFASPEA